MQVGEASVKVRPQEGITNGSDDDADDVRSQLGEFFANPLASVTTLLLITVAIVLIRSRKPNSDSSAKDNGKRKTGKKKTDPLAEYKKIVEASRKKGN